MCKQPKKVLTCRPMVVSWTSLVEVDEGPGGKLLCLWPTPKNMQHIHGIFPFMFDCWADPVVHLLLVKSSMIVYYRWYQKPKRVFSIWCRKGGQRHAWSSAVDRCHSRSRWTRCSWGQSLRASCRWGTRTAWSPFRPSCWWRRCRWPASARTKLWAETRRVFPFFGPSWRPPRKDLKVPLVAS